MRRRLSARTAAIVCRLWWRSASLIKHHAQVARHGHQHLAEVLGLRLFVRLELDLVELRQAIDQIRDRFAEAFGNLALADRRILHHVVQQRSDHPLHIHLPFGDRAGHRQGMGDVGLSRQAHLPAMRLLAEQIGLANRSISSGGR
jgi:hypothetical protein